MRTFIAYTILSFLWLTSLGNYVEVTRSANVYSESNSGSTKLFKAEVGQEYELVSSERVNGYFNIKIPNSELTGWIYRSLVRHHEQDLPSNLSMNELPTEGELKVSVIDVGAGLCTVIEMPNGQYVIYDAGHYRGSGRIAYNQILEVLPSNVPISMMILSHTDGDHIGAASYLLENHLVNHLLWTGYEKSMISSSAPTKTYGRLETALNSISYEMINENLNDRDSMVVPGTEIQFGAATMTLICGFGSPLDSWGRLTNSEQLNAVSIVVKVEYGGTSVLITGDAVGRHLDDPPGSLIATEHYMINEAGEYIDSDIILAPHHGADNGSSEAFIEAVSPEVVIFPAGSHHDHPRESTALRYLEHVDINNIYRTDRGDDEGGHSGDSKDWKHESIEGCTDSYRDDDIEIVIRANGEYSVNYLRPNPECD
jgi:beta-lactamase superfamily II metal-dependent hydrolase